MDGTETVMKPASLRAVDQIGHHVKGIRVMYFGVDNIWDGFIVEVDLPEND